MLYGIPIISVLFPVVFGSSLHLYGPSHPYVGELRSFFLLIIPLCVFIHPASRAWVRRGERKRERVRESRKKDWPNEPWMGRPDWASRT